MTTITFSKPCIEEAALAFVPYDDMEESMQILDDNINAYLGYLKALVEEEGFEFDWTPDQQAWTEHVSADTFADEELAHVSLGLVKSFWEWYN